jgi:hypothetical protein
MEAVQRNGNALVHVPKTLHTVELCIAAIRNVASAIIHVAKHVRTLEFYAQCVQHHIYPALEDLPAHLDVRDVYVTAVRNDGRSLGNIPLDCRTRELCILAVQQCSAGIMYVPSYILNDKLCKIAVQSHKCAIVNIAVKLRTSELLALAEQTDAENLTEDIYIAAIRDGSDLHHMPVNAFTTNIYTAMVETCGRKLDIVPIHLRTPELCTIAVQNDGSALEQVPMELRTSEMCMLAVENDGYAIDFVPIHLRTSEICITAMRKRGDGSCRVPEDYHPGIIDECTLSLDESNYDTLENCMVSVCRNPASLCHVPGNFFVSLELPNGYSLELLGAIPMYFRTPEVCARAVNAFFECIFNVPEHCKNAKFNEEIAHLWWREIEYVTSSDWTIDMADEIATNTWANFECIPVDFRTPELYELMIISRHTNVLKYLPKNMQTAELCARFVQNDPNELAHVDEQYCTPELCMLAVLRDGRAIEKVPERLRTAELYMAAVQNNAEAIAHVPIELRTLEMCKIVVEREKNLDNVPEQYRTLELCMLAVQYDGYQLRYVPRCFRTLELCTIAVSRGGTLIDEIPPELRTPELIEIANFFGEFVIINSHIIGHGGAVLGHEDAMSYAIGNFDNFGRIPAEMRTSDVCKAAISSCTHKLREIPKNWRTPEICLAAVINDGCGESLQHVPNIADLYEMDPFTESCAVDTANKFMELCLTAVRASSENFCRIPKVLRTHEICMAALESLEKETAILYRDVKTVDALLEVINLYGPMTAGTRMYILDILSFNENLRTVEVYMALLRQHGIIMRDIPRQFYTAELCAIGVANDGLNLIRVPMNLRTKKLCEEAVRQNGHAYVFVPYQLRSLEICVIAANQSIRVLRYFNEEIWTLMILYILVRANGQILDKITQRPQEVYMAAFKNSARWSCEIPERFQTLEGYLTTVKYFPRSVSEMPDICRTAENYMALVMINGIALKYVPVELRTMEMCTLAIQSKCTDVLKHVPMNLRTLELCMLAVQYDKISLQHVPQNVCTMELCIAAVCGGADITQIPICMLTMEFYMQAISRDCIALRDVPNYMCSEELCLAAVRNTGMALRDVPDYILTIEICTVAVRNDGNALQFVPDGMQTYELCMIAIENSARALKHVPMKLRTLEFCEIAVRHFGLALKYVPNELRTYDLCQIAIYGNGEALKYIPENLCNEQWCMVAVQTSDVLPWVPSKFRTPSIITEAVKYCPMAIGFVDSRLRTPELCMLAVQKDGRAICHVPMNLRTIEICNMAMQRDNSIFDHIPRQFINMSHCLKLYPNCKAALADECFDILKDMIREIAPDTADHIESETAHMNITTFIERSNLLDFTIVDSHDEMRTWIDDGSAWWSTPSGTIYATHAELSLIPQLSVQVRAPLHESTTDIADIKLQAIVNDMKNELGEHFDAVMQWVMRAENVAQYYDVQILAIAIQSLADEKFREIGMREIVNDNECCGDRALMSINKFYTVWQLWWVETTSKCLKDRLLIIIAGAKTIALRAAVSKGLEFYNTNESVEAFLYAETKLCEKLGLLTLANGMDHESWGNQMSLDKLEKAVNDTYLKVTAENPLLDELLDSATNAKIIASRTLYDNTIHKLIEDMSQNIQDSQYIRLLNFYGKLLDDEIMEIKINWLKSTCRSLDLL